MNRTMLALAVLFCGVATGDAQDNSPIRSKQIKLPQVEEQPMWQTRNTFGQIKATYLESTPTRVKLKMPRGDVQEIPMFYFGSPPIHYFLNKMAKIPETVTDHQMEPGRRKLISLDASKMELGKLKEWKNTGALKGGFIPMNYAPTVVDFEGHRGVRFEVDRAKYADPEFQALTSTFTLTDYLGYEAPFTMSALIHCDETGKSLDTTPIMSWGALGGDQQTTLTLGTSEVAGLSAMDGKGPGGTEGWYHMTYAYTGGHDGKLSIYRNGELLSEHQYDVKIERRETTDITATTATLNSELFSKSGTGSMRVYYGEEDHFQWYQLRHVWWDGSQVLNGIAAGDAKFELKGLKPGTKYYYRYAAYDMPKEDMGYELEYKRRWSYGPGMFVTASEDGKTPGQDIENDTRQHFFVGANRGVRWFMKTPGPSKFFKGVISKINVYDYAMDAFEVRGELGMTAAFKPTPEEGAENFSDDVELAWEPGKGNAASFRVWIGDDQKAVEAGTAKSYDTQEPKLFVKGTLSGAEQYWRVAQLDKDGKLLDKGPIWSFHNTYGRAHSPRPVVGELVNPLHVLHWEGPIQAVKEQRVIFAESPEELEAKAEKGEYLYKGLTSQNGNGLRNHTIWVNASMDVLNPGKAFYWRVDFVYDGGRLAKGPLWNFTVRDYFTPEIDTVWTKPSFDHDPRSGVGCKQSEERVGFPARSSASSPGQVMIDDETTGFSRFLYKSRKLRDYLEFKNGCAKLGYVFDGPSYGRGFSMTYGGLGGDRQKGEEIYGWNLVMHEFGHQLDSSPAAYAKDHGQEKLRIYEKCLDTNRGLGGYGGSNQGEEMAMAFHFMTFADRRDAYYKGYPEMYHLIRKIIGGDRYIDLDPRKNMDTDADAKLLSWGNAGGLIKFYGDKRGKDGRRGYGYVDNTQGTFTPVGDPIESVQVGGVAGVKLDGKSALLWNERTKLGLYGNRDFGADFWVRKKAGTGDAVIAALTGKDGKSFQFKWSDFPGAKEGVWQHLAYTYEGGETREEAGLLRIFVNEKEVASRQQKFDLPHDASISVGGWVKNAKAPAVTEGFTGELGQVRIYNYDISMDEVEEHFREESPHYFRTPAAVAEKLYVDIDCRRYEDMPQHTHEPFHPENIRKPWLRSWANFGALGGRIHNDVDTFMWEYAGSTPMLRRVDGAKVPVFQGKDRMVAGFTPNAEAVANPPRTLELWIKRDKNENLVKDVKEVALEWGEFQLTGTMLDQSGVETDGKWHHVVVLFPEPTTSAPPRFYNWEFYKKVWVAGQTIDQEDPGKRREEEQKLIREMDERLAAAAEEEANYEAEVFVDGKPAGKINGLLRLIERDRLHLGGHYDFDLWNWKHYFSGAFSAIRVHKGALTPAQIQANAAMKPQDEDKSIPVELVFDVNAENLPDGKLSEWKYTGSGGGTFKPGEPVLNNQPKVMEFNGNVGLGLGEKHELVSSFNVPEAMTKGPFTILTYYAKPVSPHGVDAPILRWDRNTYSLTRGAWNPYGNIFSWRQMEVMEGQKPSPRTRSMFYWPGTGSHLSVSKERTATTGMQYFHEPTTHNNNAHMEYVWKTKCLSYDGKTVRWIVDGQLEREEPATIYTEPLKPDQKPRQVPLTIGGKSREGKSTAAVLNYVTIYDKAFSVVELEKATTVVKREPLKGKPIVDVDFGKLKSGSLVYSFKNAGTLGGEFRSPDAVEAAARKEPREYAPMVKTEDGVRVVAFDGKDNFLESDETAQRTMTDNEPFTFAAFIKPGKNGERPALLTVSEKAGFGYSNGGMKVEGLRRQSRDNKRPGQSGVKVGPWVHVACVYEGTRKPSHIYVDGKRVNSVYWSAYFARPDFKMKIGKEFGGGIARMQMWRGVKSAEEIAKMAQAAHGRVVLDEKVDK